jgi:putative acetyltransferase
MWKKRLEQADEQTYSLVACADGEVVGMAVHDNWHAKGVGTALMKALIDLADNWLNLSRLELDVFTDNEPALRLYQKLGFVIEGTQRKHAFRDGEYVDSHRMACVR